MALQLQTYMVDTLLRSIRRTQFMRIIRNSKSKLCRPLSLQFEQPPISQATPQPFERAEAETFEPWLRPRQHSGTRQGNNDVEPRTVEHAEQVQRPAMKHE